MSRSTGSAILVFSIISARAGWCAETPGPSAAVSSTETAATPAAAPAPAPAAASAPAAAPAPAPAVPTGPVPSPAAEAVPAPAPAPGAAVAVRPSAFLAQHKSALLGTAMAVFPGLLVHGTGHIYAGRAGSGLVLTAIEGTGIGLIAAGAKGGYDMYRDLRNSSSNGDLNLPSSISGLARWEALAVGGTILFLSSWLYDIVGTPKAVSVYNARVDREIQQAAAEPATRARDVAAAPEGGGQR